MTNGIIPESYFMGYITATRILSYIISNVYPCYTMLYMSNTNHYLKFSFSNIYPFRGKLIFDIFYKTIL